mmetsp:Transcript_545/g.1474  ORF Transcript_545/g.1474 Transcript_545/m.1474 type:complete len:379 (-) Transcript_545:931-2067(-)
MRLKILRAPMTAVTMVDRPASVSTMSAAPRAASVAPCTAMPTSAFLSAGASFTPSPVMPTAKPHWRSASTMRYLCSGYTWPKPSASRIISPKFLPRSLGILPSASMLGRPLASLMLVFMPSMRAVSLAMSTWSPVIILTSTPYSMALWMVALVSGRGGSRKVSRPSSFHCCPSSWRATARQRMPRWPKFCTWRSAAWQTWASVASSSSLMMMWGAPLVTLNTLPSGPLSVPSVRLTVGSKGMKSICSNTSSEGRSAHDSTSVSSASRAGSFHLAASAAMRSSSFWSMLGTKQGVSSWIIILFRVSVPVLSEQSTSMPAISSTADMRATMAPSLASLKAPRARVTDSTVGMAMGMPPTMMTSMLVRVGQPSSPPVQAWW